MSTTADPIRHETVLVTPDLARTWMGRNTINRPISMTKVGRIVAKMREGRWVFTHQGVAFSKSGELLDGQHRLLAVIETNMPFEFLVSWNLDREAFYHMDTGGTRTAADLVSSRCPDMKNRSHVCAIANMSMRGAVNAGATPNKEDVVDFVEWYRTYLEKISAEIRSLEGLAARAAVGAAFMNCIRGPDEWTGAHGGRSERVVYPILERYANMAYAGDDDPMKVLYKRLSKASSSKRAGSSYTDNDIYRLTVSAIRACLQGKTLQSVVATDVDWGAVADYGHRPKQPRKKGGKLSLVASSLSEEEEGDEEDKAAVGT